MRVNNKGTLLGTPNREPQEHSRNIMEYKDPGRYIPIRYLLYSWGSLFGVPRRVPLYNSSKPCTMAILECMSVKSCWLGGHTLYFLASFWEVRFKKLR